MKTRKKKSNPTCTLENKHAEVIIPSAKAGHDFLESIIFTSIIQTIKTWSKNVIDEGQGIGSSPVGWLTNIRKIAISET